MTRFRKLVCCILVVIIALGIIGSASTPLKTSGRLRMHPLLVELSEKTPQSKVQVIVQKWSDSDETERLLVRLGGTITQDLHIIRAFSATLEAGALRTLADHPSVRWISPDAAIENTYRFRNCRACIDTSRLLNAYVQAIGADRLFNTDPAYLQGQGIGVAVVDSGIDAKSQDLLSKCGMRRITGRFKINELAGETPSYVNEFRVDDRYGHGTHIAGIIGGNGAISSGAYIGAAPQVNLIDVAVTDDQGAAKTSDVVAGLQWIYENKDLYNIRVVNLSLNSDIAESYHTSPLDAAVEILWFNGIVVVVSAGNNGASGVLYPPANDPFVITVGAMNDVGTTGTEDDYLASFSAYGLTESGFYKPDLVAPGVDIISLQPVFQSWLAQAHPDHIVDPYYFRMSGTSMASAVVAGATALLLQDEPYLNPDQVKYRLMATTRPSGDGTGAGYLDIYNAVYGTTTETANTGIPASQLLWTGSDPVNWGSVSWGSVSWGSVSWGSVSWGSVSWGSDYWGP